MRGPFFMVQRPCNPLARSLFSLLNSSMRRPSRGSASEQAPLCFVDRLRVALEGGNVPTEGAVDLSGRHPSLLGAEATLFLKPSEKVTFIQPATMAPSPVLLQGAISFLEALWGHARRAHLIEDALTD